MLEEGVTDGEAEYDPNPYGSVGGVKSLVQRAIPLDTRYSSIYSEGGESLNICPSPPIRIGAEMF